MSKYSSECSCGSAKEKKAERCARCSNIRNSPHKSKLPPDEKILLMLPKESAPKVAKKLGVSLTTIKNIKLKYKE